MRREDARAQVLSLWRQWSATVQPEEGTAVHLFWEYLQARHPHVVDFASYNPYAQVRQWLAEDCEP